MGVRSLGAGGSGSRGGPGGVAPWQAIGSPKGGLAASILYLFIIVPSPDIFLNYLHFILS